MKKPLFIVVMLSFSSFIFADVFDDLDMEVALVDKYCTGGQGRYIEELITNKNTKTGNIISEKIVPVVYCRNGNRHVVGKTEDFNKKPVEYTKKLFDELDSFPTNRQYKCTFPASFLIAECNRNQYFYVESLSGIKRADLATFYRFVKKQSGEEGISDICVDFINQNKKFIKCNDFGIVLETH